MVRSKIHIYTLVMTVIAGSGIASASTILGGLEDTPGKSGLEKNGDFNDMLFELNGNVSMEAPGGVFNNLNSGVVNENGSVFWANPSLDGTDKNVGEVYLYASPFSNLQYLALSGGGSANNVTFDATGTITLTYLGGIAANAKLNTLGWYNLASPGVLNQLIAWPDAAGESVSFQPGGAFALYSLDGGSQIYRSVSADNVNENAGQQHFAFFTTPDCNPPQVPEPSSAALLGIGVVLLGLGSLPRAGSADPNRKAGVAHRSGADRQ